MRAKIYLDVDDIKNIIADHFNTDKSNVDFKADVTFDDDITAEVTCEMNFMYQITK